MLSILSRHEAPAKDHVQISSLTFSGVDCGDFTEFIVCRRHEDGSCVIIYSSYPTTRQINVIELTTLPVVQNEADSGRLKAFCESKVFKYVPVY
jgi:hypothetical protein